MRVVMVIRPCDILLQPGVIVDTAVAQPVAHLAPHVRPHVGVLEVGGSPSELDFHDVRVAELLQPVDNRAPDPRPIDKHHRDGVAVIPLVEHLGRFGDQAHRIARLLAGDANGPHRARIRPPSEAKHVPVAGPHARHQVRRPGRHRVTSAQAASTLISSMSTATSTATISSHGAALYGMFCPLDVSGTPKKH